MYKYYQEELMKLRITWKKYRKISIFNKKYNKVNQFTCEAVIVFFYYLSW